VCDKVVGGRAKVAGELVDEYSGVGVTSCQVNNHFANWIRRWHRSDGLFVIALRELFVVALHQSCL